MSRFAAVGTVLLRDEQPGTVFLTIAAPAAVARYLVPKGSVTVDGTSLTVVDVTPQADGAARFRVAPWGGFYQRRPPESAGGGSAAIRPRLGGSRLWTSRSAAAGNGARTLPRCCLCAGTVLAAGLLIPGMHSGRKLARRRTLLRAWRRVRRFPARLPR